MIFRLTFGNWASRIYLLVVVAVSVLVTASLTMWNGPDANLAGVWLIFVTLPFSFVGALVLDSPAGLLLLIIAIVLSALTNAFLIGLALRLSRRRTLRNR